MAESEFLRTGEVAEAARVNVQTLRYYERIGLLAEPRRRSSGYRAYPPEAVRTVRFIKQAQTLGFSLEEIEVLLRLAEGGPESCSEARGLATSRIAEMDRKIEQLTTMREALRSLVATCERPREDRECPLTHAIDECAADQTLSSRGPNSVTADARASR